MSLTKLAEGILAEAKVLDQYVASQGSQQVSFTQDTLLDLPDDLESSRKSIVNLSQSIKRLALGSIGQLLESLFTASFTDLLAIRFIYRNNVPKHVPSYGQISYPDLAKASGLDEKLLRRFVQDAMLSNIFIEPEPGYVSHSSLSRLLKEDPEAMDTIGFLVEDLNPASMRVIEAQKKWPGSGEPNETGFNIENNTDLPFYVEIGKDEERARRFGGGMRFMTRGSLYDINHLIQGYSWSELDEPGRTVVDIGGGHGGVSRALAKTTSHLQFVVQDLPGTAEEGQKILPAELKGRVKFQGHDFMKPQPVKNADVYFLRFILHNWSDKYCQKILENLLPAVKDGSRVVIYEFLLPEEADTLWTAKQGRNLDMIQTTCWNSLERTTLDWKKLFESVDTRFQFVGTRTPKGSSVSLIEAVYRDRYN